MVWGESFVALVFCGPRRFVCDFPHAREAIAEGDCNISFKKCEEISKVPRRSIPNKLCDYGPKENGSLTVEVSVG